tara:strand:+ start:525 stop:1781 length:1257 start_codon:yes stop_codon:yes gene_type:complete
MEEPSFVMIPSAYNARVVYSILPNNGIGDFTFVRSGDATRINKDGLIETVDSHVPRLNYDLVNGVPSECPSLLLEPQSTNVVTYSNDLSNSYWTLSNASINSSLQTSPEGINNARKVDFSATSSTARIVRSVMVANNKSLSFFFKYDSLDQIMVYIRGIDKGSYLDVKNAVFLGGNAVGGGIDANNVSIENYSNGWYRFIYSHATSDVDGIEIYAALNQSYASVTLTGSVLLWGFQLEDLSYATSYIPSDSGSSTTRSAEACNSAGNASTFNSEQGILFAEIAALADDGTSRIISLSDSSDTNRVHLFYNVSSNTVNVNYRVAGSSKAIMSFAVSDATIMQKIAYKWKSGNFELFVNGVNRGTSSNTTMMPANTMNQLAFNVGGGGLNFYGKCKDLRVYDTEGMTDTEINNLLTQLTQ